VTFGADRVERKEDEGEGEKQGKTEGGGV